MAYAQISYYSTGPTVLTFKRGPKNFIAEDSARVHDNVATSGYRERVFEASDILISFTMPALLIGDDYIDWKNFYKWALAGGTFAFLPNPSVLVLSSPWFFNCVLEDTGFKPKRIGMQRYSLDCKFRAVPDTTRPVDAGAVMNAFYGGSPT